MVWSPEGINELVYRGGPTKPQQGPGIADSLPTFDPASLGGSDPAGQRKGFFLARLGNVQNYSPGLSGNQSDYLDKAEEMIFRANQLNQQAAQLRSQRSVDFQGGPPDPVLNYGIRTKTNAVGSVAQAPTGNNKLSSFINAIAGKESGGNYRAVNKDSGALGKYQIMPSNFAGPGGWDRDALGKDITVQQFLNDPRVQEKIARTKLTQYYRKYGPRGAASAWYSGDPNKWQNNSPQGGYPSIAAYVQAIMNAMRKRNG
jgi:hypothetical protein